MTPDQISTLEHYRDMLEVRMKDKPRRYAHSLGVAKTSVALARTYGVDEFEAAVAGLLHDWDKVLDDAELLARAARFGVSVVGPASLAVGLLHGPVAAHDLPHVFRGISASALRAIDRHTIGALDMGPLDMVVFVADAIEPGRHGDYARALRDMVGDASLDELFFQCFSQGLAYVISSGRYLYPTAVQVYNHYAVSRLSK